MLPGALITNLGVNRFNNSKDKEQITTSQFDVFNLETMTMQSANQMDLLVMAHTNTPGFIRNSSRSLQNTYIYIQHSNLYCDLDLAHGN